MELTASEVDAPQSAHRQAKARQKAATRGRILAAAKTVFFRDGFANANLNEVVALAGVGKGTLYRHFESKGDLFLAMLIDKGDVFLDEMIATIPKESDALEKIKQIAAFYIDFWTRHPEYFQILWAVENPDRIGGISDGMLKNVVRYVEGPMRLLEKIIQAGVESGQLHPCDPWSMANAIVEFGNACIAPIVDPHRKDVIERDMRSVYSEGVGLVLRGMAPQPLP